MKVLAVNSGSSSLKFQMYEMPEEEVLISGTFERIGVGESFYTIKLNGEKTKIEVDLKDHKAAFSILIEELIKNEIVSSLDEIEGIGHRVVQGGTEFDKSVVITDKVLSVVEELSSLAPLHNPPAIIGVNAAKSLIPNAAQVAVFDTSFHQTMPEYNYLYSVPYSWHTDYNVRKYGYHGTSHMFISKRANEILGRDDTKLITCHIGNGASVSAVVNGKCLNTSMGLTPNSGVMMGTRCGDIDATIVNYMVSQVGMDIKDVDNTLNKASGYIGICGYSDARDVEAGVMAGDEKCILAQKMYVRRIANYIAQYYVEMGGCDSIIFTAGLGENSPMLRHDVINELKVFGIILDGEQNKIRAKEGLITTKESSIPVYVIPTDEEMVIARDTYAFLSE